MGASGVDLSPDLLAPCDRSYLDISLGQSWRDDLTIWSA